MSQTNRPPMKPSGEANEHQLNLARKQGKCLEEAVKHMMEKVAHDGEEKPAGDYLVGYAVEEAEGLYHYKDRELVWEYPDEENVHVEVAVRDRADGRFIPGLTVHATLFDADGNKIGSHDLPFLWHSWLYHYGMNWKVPGDGTYKLHVRIEPPTFPRHDKENGKRYAEPVEVDFDHVEIKTGHD